MELVYKGRYYTGQSSTPITVDIVWLDGGLSIRYNDRGTGAEVFWKREEIEQTEIGSAIVTLRYGHSFPQQQLEVTDKDFIARYKKEYAVGLMHRLKLTSPLFVVGLIGAVGISVWLAYLFLLPAVADYGAQVFPRDLEISMGKELYTRVLEDEEIDTAKTIAINRFFNQLKIEKDYPVKITVVRSPIVNAFALPGGGIVVYEGILKNMSSADQLAALLSHEYSHVQMKHATRNLFRSTAGYIFISIIFSDVNGVASVLAENANSLRNLSYSRELESEADNNGLLILRNNHISATGMKELFELLKKESNGIEVSEIISTHPDLDNRIKNAEHFMKTNPYRFYNNDSLVYYFKEITTLHDTATVTNH